MKFLVLEDDLLLAELITEHLKEKGYDVVFFSDGEDAYEYLYENRVDILLLDINVPGINGSNLLKNLRKENITTPAIFITSLNSSIDVKNGFEIGCDDYIKKPFEFEELDARIEHILKIYNLNNETIDLKICKFNPSKHFLVYDNKKVSLTPKASEILLYLINNRGKIISKDELIQNIWGYEDMPTEATIRSYIKILRKHFPNIKTYRGSGYEFGDI